MTHCRNVHRTRLLGALALALTLVLSASCERTDNSKPKAPPGSSGPDVAAPVAKENTLEVLFVYGSEKKAWIDAVTATFNAQQTKTAGGKIIQVKTEAMGSGESKDAILSGEKKAHIWSPASGVFVTLANAQSQVKGGPLVGATENLVLSPVVIAMWKPMAEALGWPAKPIGWAQVLQLARDPKGWASCGHPEFGAFKFGHTHPDYSNSGLISILAEVYAGAGKVRGLSNADLDQPAVAGYLRDIEASVVHYGRSTGFFGDALMNNGPGYLSAAVVYESIVVESYGRSLASPIVAIYPQEGTFWSDHPVGIVQREWVTPEHQEAAKAYIKYLLAPEQQAKALAYGFRPAQGETGAPLDAAHGVDPSQPKTILELPPADVVNKTVELWRANKKRAQVALVFDQSGSMSDDQKIVHARAGAKDLVEMLTDDDSMTFIPFSTNVNIIPGGPLKTNRADMNKRLDAILPDGNTHLYEAILAGQTHLQKNADARRIAAIVVLTDGEDNGDKVTLDQLLRALQGDKERGGVRVFTIGYGSSAALEALKKIASESKGQYYQGTPQNIRKVFQDIATFF